MSSKKEVTYNVGWEIEASTGASYIPDGVNITHDGSVRGEGLEYYLDKSLIGDLPTAMQKLRRLVSDKRMRVGKSCGFHVHISPNGMSREKAKSWAGWMVTLARMVEDEAFLAVPESRQENSMCRRLKDTSHSIKNRSYSRSKYSNSDRYYWLNVVEMMRPGGIKTVEIRLLGSTRRFVWLQAWVAVCLFMAKVSHDLMDDPSGFQCRVEEIRNAFKKIRIFLEHGHESSFKISKTMASNMGLIGQTPENTNRSRFIGSVRSLNSEYSYYYGPSNPRYSTDQVAFYMGQEMDEARREYKQYLRDVDSAYEENRRRDSGFTSPVDRRIRDGETNVQYRLTEEELLRHVTTWAEVPS